jgi:hypothetical protein
MTLHSLGCGSLLAPFEASIFLDQNSASTCPDGGKGTEEDWTSRREFRGENVGGIRVMCGTHCSFPPDSQDSQPFGDVEYAQAPICNTSSGTLSEVTARDWSITPVAGVCNLISWLTSFPVVP